MERAIAAACASHVYAGKYFLLKITPHTLSLALKQI